MTLDAFLTSWNDSTDRVLVHTSGSTGKPKPMFVEKKRMLGSARMTCDFLGLQPGDLAFLCMPLDYIAGKMMVVRSIERQLELQVVEPTGHPLKGITIDSNRHSLAAMVPLQVYNTLQVAEETEQLKHFTHLIIGGGAIDTQLAECLKDFPNYVWSTYGMTETLSHVAVRRLNGPEATEWYKPFSNVCVAIINEGCKICGRKDNVICCGGIKIQIEEVETALRPWLKHPFMISKRLDQKFGETMVLLTEDSQLSVVKDICLQRLPKYWQPKAYIHVASLPMTETGKPARAKALALAKEI